MFEFASTLVFFPWACSCELADWSQNQALQPGLFVETHGVIFSPNTSPCHGQVATVPGERGASAWTGRLPINNPARDPRKSVFSPQTPKIRWRTNHKEAGEMMAMYTEWDSCLVLINVIIPLAYMNANIQVSFSGFLRFFLLLSLIFLSYTCCNRKL